MLVAVTLLHSRIGILTVEISSLGRVAKIHHIYLASNTGAAVFVA